MILNESHDVELFPVDRSHTYELVTRMVLNSNWIYIIVLMIKQLHKLVSLITILTEYVCLLTLQFLQLKCILLCFIDLFLKYWNFGLVLYLINKKVLNKYQIKLFRKEFLLKFIILKE